MANQLLVKRCAVGDLVILGTDSAFTQNSNVYIPAGAIITGIRYIAANTAVTIVDAAQTFAPYVVSQVLAVTLDTSLLPAQTVGYAATLHATGGVIVTASGELNMRAGASGASTAAGTWKYYVDYLFVPEGVV